MDQFSTAPVTLHGNGRRIEGASQLVGLPENGGVPATLHGRSWLYRADLGDWIRLEVLGTDSRVPLPPEFEDLLVCGLALRLAPRFGTTPDPLIAARHTDMLDRLKKRYKQSERLPSTMELRQHMREI